MKVGWMCDQCWKGNRSTRKKCWNCGTPFHLSLVLNCARETGLHCGHYREGEGDCCGCGKPRWVEE